MTTATTSAHDVSIALHNEVLEGIQTVLSKNPKQALFSFRGSQLDSIRGYQSEEARELARSSFHAHSASAELTRGYSWTYYCFYEKLPSDTDLFKVTVVVRRPGMLYDIIDACVEKLQRVMQHYDVDDAPVTIEFQPLSIYSVMYPESIAATYLSYVANEVAARLSTERISITINDHDSFECRRT